MLPKNGCTGLDSGLKKPRLMVLLVLISTDFTWRENNVRSGYCWWSNARHEWHSGIHPVPTGKYASKVAEANADIATAQANDAINRGNAEAEQRRRETRQRLGTQAATMGRPAPIYLPVTRWIYLATLPSLALLIR